MLKGGLLPTKTKSHFHRTFVRPTRTISAERHVSQTGFWLPLSPQGKFERTCVKIPVQKLMRKMTL